MLGRLFLGGGGEPNVTKCFPIYSNVKQIHILGCRPNQSETESEPGSSGVVSTPSGPTQVEMCIENDRGEDQVEVTPVSDSEQDDERQPPKRYATDRGHFEEDVSDATVKRFIITTGSCKPSGSFRRNQEKDTYTGDL